MCLTLGVTFYFQQQKYNIYYTPNVLLCGGQFGMLMPPCIAILP